CLDHRQIGDIETVIVVAPLALAKDGLRNLLDRQVRESIGSRAKRLATDKQGTLVTDLLRDGGELLMRQVLRRDVDEVRLRRPAVHPVTGFVRLINESHQLAHGLRELDRIEFLRDDPVAPGILLKQGRREAVVAETTATFPAEGLCHTARVSA